MKKFVKVGRKILTCVAFLFVAILIAVAVKLSKGVNPYKKFLLEAQMEGCKILITQHKTNILNCDTFIRFKNDSINKGEGSEDVLKEGISVLQDSILNSKNAIVFYKKELATDLIAYKKLIKK
jgi:hypothetical protein